MGEYVLRTKSIYKKYGKSFALDNINIEIKKGEIYGFIGQNGAGKTTLLRVVTGLTTPTKGTVELFGQSSEKGLVKSIKRVGAVVESPALFPNMSAYENLELHRLQKGIPDKKCIDRTLKLVGLENTGRKKVVNFSLGMKQRLGIAIALLSDPEFLILDEPTNGLDPMGIVELRQLIKRLNREREMTVLISSHILSELHQLATRYGIIHKGRLLEEISASELNQKCRQYLRIKVDNPSKGATVLEAELNSTDFEIMPDGIIKLYSHLNDIQRVSLALTKNNLIIEHFSQAGDDLESYFAKLVGGVNND
ncbi:MAG: ABC transporter ATP-binding protein [Tissierellia bacterium]|jgi:ABC-2 type transport system ATP-binding protein|nr:ABC transporter ATP-binding protein [Tissierellia bacterium]